MQESDPLGIGSYMRSRMRELFGSDIFGGGIAAEPFDVPRFALNEPLIEEVPFITPSSSSFYVNPDVEWAFPEGEVVMPPKGPAQTGDKARGHRPIPGVGTEILETTNTRPARSPRRLFRVDVTENDEFYFLRADLAGMTKENVKISVDENQNLISFNIEPPKDDFFGLYKSPLESQFSKEKEGEIKKEPENVPKESTKQEEMKSAEVEIEESKFEEIKQQEQHPEQSAPSGSLAHKKEICHLIERSTQPMIRTLKMPKAVDMSKIEAEMKEGLLVVKFAKTIKEVEEDKKHYIEIK